MSRRNSIALGSRRGMTLLEVLLAVFLTGLVTTGAMGFFMVLSNLWMKTTPTRNLDLHARQVVQWVRKSMHEAIPVEQGETAYVFLDSPSGQGGLSEPLLTWEVPEGDGILAWPDVPLPYVIYQLKLRPDEGLFLYWQSRLEEEFQETPPRQTLLSPYVTQIQYQYYDTDLERWDSQGSPRNNSQGTYDVPWRIKLVFDDEEGEEISYLINLPNAAEGLPLF